MENFLALNLLSTRLDYDIDCLSTGKLRWHSNLKINEISISCFRILQEHFCVKALNVLGTQRVVYLDFKGTIRRFRLPK